MTIVGAAPGVGQIGVSAVLGVLGIAAPAAAQAPVVNARVEARAVAGTLAADIQATADRGAAAWIGYRVPMVTRGGRLQFTWISASTNQRRTVVTIDFQPLGETTEVTLLHVGLESVQSRDGHTRGWSALLDQPERR